MSHGSIFRFQTQASAITGVTASDFHHAALDADASARLAAIDRAFTEDEERKVEPVEDAQKKIEQLNLEPAAAESPESESLAGAHNLPPQHELAHHPDAQVPLETESNIEEEMLAVLTAQAEAARASARPCSNPACAKEIEAEIDPSDPLAILSQTIAPQPVNDLTAAPEVDLVQVESPEPESEVLAEVLVRDSTEALPEVVTADLVEATLEVTEEETPQLQTSATTEETETSSEASAEVAGIAAAEAACEILVAHSAANESPANESSLTEAAIVESEITAEPDSSAPVPLEVAPILDASGELQPGADDYTPPAPFQIHVPEALVVAATPSFEADDQVTDETVTEPVNEPLDEPAPKHVSTSDLSETFDLDSLCAPTAAEQLTVETIEQAIAQEEAVAEIKAAAEEFVTQQIAHDDCVEAQLHADSPVPSPPVGAAVNETAATAVSPLASAAAALKAEPASDRRKKRRALISSPIRVRSIDVTVSGPDEIATTVDVSRYGILFETVLDTYQRGMDVAVVFPYHKNATGQQGEQFGRVVRLHELPNGRHAVAIALGVGIGEHLVDSSGRQLAKEPVQLSNTPAPVAKKILVLVADSDAMLRDTTKLYLQNEGYEVIAVSNANDAREVLNMFMPAMIVAEIEGDGDVLPGLDLCAHVKSSPSLKHVPVVLTSRSAYPSDYSNAHSMGAVVCMAKPYKLERLGHIVRLLAPLPEHMQAPSTQRTPDPTRGFRADSNVSLRTNGAARNAKKSNGSAASNLKSKFKFPTFR
jgi:CheY-like chemotaxis protein